MHSKTEIVATLLLTIGYATSLRADENTHALKQFHEQIEPILENYCYDCHGEGNSKGGISLDTFESDTHILESDKLWEAVLANVRSGLMPPSRKSQPDEAEVKALSDWIKFGAFGIDPKDVDPGHVVPRRLNRVEYQNTIRDLLGDYKFQASVEFPPDDTGGGFDNNGEVLTLSTLLIEKYLAAAETIIANAVLDEDDYDRFFPDSPPDDAAARDAYAAKILKPFATQAFRRPVDDEKIEQLVSVARSFYSKPDTTFSDGVGKAMMAVLASPRFLFRIEEPKPRLADGGYPQLDEFELASRLSYFLWSTMPDKELFDLAAAGKLRSNLSSQIDRMLKDSKISQGIVRNFTGQWLQARDVITVEINGKAVLGKGPVNGNRKTKYDFDGKIRQTMREETELYFKHVLRENRSVLEFINSDYTFLNERLAKHYGISDVKGDKFRKVKLSPDSPRGGVLTQGTVLAVTSNPTRTSPVKRGVFVLENILGTPPPPPPPDIPELEAAIDELKEAKPTLRDMLAIHRKERACSSCHNRMDPIGLAFENFIPMGTWRETEGDKPIDVSGRLITGEKFDNVSELKAVLADDRRMDFYRCLTKKMLAYALGRSLNPHDTHVVDSIVERLVRENGQMSALLLGIIESAPFQLQGIPPEN